MVVNVRKKPTESNEGLIRRFIRKVQSSGVLLQAKNRRFYIGKKSKRQVRDAALRREAIRDEIDYLRKIGKLPEESEYGSSHVNAKNLLRPKVKK